MKKEKVVALILSTLLLISPMISASLISDTWNKITGKATEGSTSVSITVGNTAPAITFVQAISAQDLVESNKKSVTFYFTASDNDGYTNLDDATAKAYFQKSGQTTRSNTSCVAGVGSGNLKNYTCTIDMWFFDQAGVWTINTTIEDINDAPAENSSTTFSINTLTAMTMSPSALTWPQVGPTSSDVGSNNDPTKINNTGNAENLHIEVKALDLTGVTRTNEFIFANNFTVGVATEGCSGTAMVNNTFTTVGTSTLTRGNYTLNDGTAQEQVFFCLKGLPTTISAQEYSSSGLGSWTVKVAA